MLRLEPIAEVLTHVDDVLERIRGHRPARVDASLITSVPELGADPWSGLCAAATPWSFPTEANYRDCRFAGVRHYLRTHSTATLREFAEPSTTATSIEAYVEQMLGQPDHCEPAVELRPSSRLLARFEPPGPVLDALELSRYHSGKTDDPEAIVTYAYLAGAGHASDLHFDRDGRHVFNLQLIGHKRFVLFAPQSGPMLDPIMQFGGIRAREWTSQQRRDFVAYAGGCEVVLGPGEALYIPPFYWHHVDYLDAAAGVGLRVRPPDAGLRRVLARIPANYLLQIAVAELLGRSDEVGRRWRSELESFVAAPVLSARGYYEATRTTLLRCLDELGVPICAGGSPVVDSVDFGAPMFSHFMTEFLSGERAASLGLARGVAFEPIDEHHVVVRARGSVPVPIEVGRALLEYGRGFSVEQLIADHPEIDAGRWARVIDRLRELGVVVEL